MEPDCSSPPLPIISVKIPPLLLSAIDEFGRGRGCVTRTEAIRAVLAAGIDAVRDDAARRVGRR